MSYYRSPHKQTLKIIKNGLKITKDNYRQKFITKLQQRRGYWSRFRHYLFLNPNLNFVVLGVIWLIIMLIIIIFDMQNRDTVTKVIFICISLISLFTIPFSLLKFTPKLEIGWDNLWKSVSEYYLEYVQSEMSDNMQNNSQFKSFQLTIYNLFN